MNHDQHHPDRAAFRAQRAEPARNAILGLAGCALGSLALVACGGGGGGGSGGSNNPPEPALNEGSFSLNDFDYVDTHPVGYQPLGTDGYQVLAREELFAILPGPDGTSRSYIAQEDPGAAHAAITALDGLFAGEGIVQSAASGQMDADPESELIVATLAPLGTSLTLHLVDRLTNGQYTRTPIQSIAAGAWSFVDARVTLGDVDHDFRDEIIVVVRSARFGVSGGFGQVWTFDDVQAGTAQMMTFLRDGEHIDLWGLPIDADGDQRAEVVVGLSGDSTDAGRYAVRLFDLEEGQSVMTEIHGWQYLYAANDQRDSRAVVGDFDADGREDLAWIGYERTTSTVMSIELHELGPDLAWHAYASFALIDISPAPAFKPQNWAATAFDPDVRRTDLSIAYPAGSDYSYTALHYDRTQDQWSTRTHDIDRFRSGQGIELRASDVDADGAQEVQVALLSYGFASGSLDIGCLEHDVAVGLVWQDTVTLASGPVISGVPPVVVLAPGDFDADGFALRSTGWHSVKLGDPVPLVVLSAPPTVSGISQNYDDTESSYSAGTTQGASIGVSTYSSVTYSAGGGFDLFGLIGVSGRASLEKGVERTQTTTHRETVVQGFRGAHDADVIVFQGTLYEVYEYEIVAASDPLAVGSFITLDIPNDSNIYKWTVPYYNQNVAPDDRIDTDVLTHTPGDLESYPTRAELAALTLGEMHWDLPGVHTVGQGGASNFQAVSFEDESATEEQRTVTKSYGGGASFGIEVGADVTSTQGTTHGMVYAFETTWEAAVGDILVPADYDDWRYNWGFSVHTVGRLADASNQPDGYTERKHSFEYLRYWAEPTGAGF